MNVLLFHRDLVFDGGVGQCFLQFARYYDPSRMNLYVGGLEDGRQSLTAALSQLGVPTLTFSGDPYAGPAYRLRQTIVREDITLIVATSFRAYLVAKTASYGLGCSVVFWIHSIPLVMEGSLRRTMFRRMARRDNLIFVSNAVRDAHVYDAHEGAAYVVYNGVDDPNGAEDIAPYPRSQRVELGIPDDAVVIGYTAAFIGWKNHCVLLQAFAEILRGNPNVRLLLIGGGALRKPAMESAAEMGLEDRVIFTGRRRDARRLLGLMDIYAHPADGEGFGLAVVEAMLAGLPAVVTRAGALPEIVRHERNGLLVDTNDAASLAEALGRLTNDAGLRSTLGAQGRADCLERFAPSLYAHRLTEILLRTCGQEYAASAAAAVEG